MRAGLSLIEVTIAFLILGLALLPVLTTLGTSTRQAAQTAEYSLALALEQKVSEELRQGAWENIYLADTLSADPSFNVPLPIAGGISPFFATLEDSRAPFGETLIGSDPGIEVDQPALHRQVESFTLAAAASPAQLTSGAALDVLLQMAWSDPVAAGRRLELPVRLPRRTHVVNRPHEVQDRDGADQLARELLFPTADGLSLGQAAAQAGADLDAVRALGDAAVLSRAYTDSTTEFRAALAAAESAAAGGGEAPGPARAQLLVARLHERRAAVALQMCAYLLDPLRALAAAQPARLGNARFDPARVVRPVAALAGLPGAFEQELYAARDAYAQGYAAPLGLSLRPRQRVRVLLKVLDLSKLGVVTVGPPDVAPLRALLADLERLQIGRNANVAQFARAEARRYTDIATLKAVYPVPEYQAALELRTLAPEAARRLGELP